MSFDAYAGDLIQATRQNEGLTQAELAARMTEQGFPMRQQTILKIEKGLRALRLDEALAMSDILGFDVYLFRPQAPIEEQLSDLYDLLGESQQRIIGSIQDRIRTNRSVAGVLDFIREQLADEGLEVPMVNSIAEELNLPILEVVAHALALAEERVASGDLANSRIVRGDDEKPWVEELREREQVITDRLRQLLNDGELILGGDDAVDPEA